MHQYRRSTFTDLCLLHHIEGMRFLHLNKSKVIYVQTIWRLLHVIRCISIFRQKITIFFPIHRIFETDFLFNFVAFQVLAYVGLKSRTLLCFPTRRPQAWMQTLPAIPVYLACSLFTSIRKPRYSETSASSASS